jgi:fucose 4-O-acetylase-like acetyltransferase
MRYLVGFSGSLFFILLISKSDIFLSGMKLYNKMALYGRYTLGIYVLQTILVVNIFPDIVEWNMQNEILLNFVVAPLISLFVLLICIIMIKLLSSSRNLDILMFGGQYSK